MKIVEVCFSLMPGGAERFVVDLSNELSKNNEVILLTLKDDKTDVNIRTFYRDEVDKIVRYVNLGLPDGFHCYSLWKIYRFLSTEAPDIIHLNGHKVPYFCFLAIMLLYKTPFIQTIHSDIANYKDIFYKFLTSSLVKKYMNYHFVALSKNNYNDLRKCYPNADSYLVFNGRSPMQCTNKYNDVYNLVHSFDKSSLICIHVARFCEAKNQELLVRSFERIINGGYNVQLIILGSGFDSCEAEKLRNLCGPNIHFMGPQKNVVDYLLSSDLFCLSSKYEGLPISILEAQLCGIPIVSTPVCGVLDVVADGKNGFISADFTEDSYVDAFDNALKNIYELKENARDLIQNSPYTIRKCADEYLDIFKTITGK